jgi:hypothetical protein
MKKRKSGDREEMMLCNTPICCWLLGDFGTGVVTNDDDLDLDGWKG